ncbi:ubiquitin hydrolase [Novymonas esmeraldas]|uniref:Ubiquitin hydrolase n=1 Tax=Novymonas esmeraldas TaxID=1808958 RepID=A0AAW0ER79_9TRYP
MSHTRHEQQQQQQQQLSHSRAARQAVLFNSGGNQPRSQSEESSLLPPTHLISETSFHPSSRGRLQRGDPLMAQKRQLRARSSTVRSSAQRTSVRPSGAAAATVTPTFASSSYNSKCATTKDGDAAGAASGSGVYDYACGSPAKSPEETCGFNTPRAHSDLAAPGKKSREHSGVGGGGGPLARIGSMSLTESHSGAAATVTREAPIFATTASATPSVSSKSKSRTDAGCAGGAAAVPAATPAPPARLHPLVESGVPSSVAATHSKSPPSLSLPSNGSVNGVGLRGKTTSFNALAPLRLSPSSSSHSMSTVTVPEALGRPSQVKLTTPTASPVVASATPGLRPLSTPPTQQLVSSSSTPSQTRAGAAEAAKADSFDTAVALSDGTSPTPRAVRLQPHPPLQQPRSSHAGVATTAAVEKAAPLSPSVDREHAPAPVAADPLPVVALHAAPPPLRNFGATCYLNSVLQCLLCTPGLLRALNADRQRIVRDWEAERRSATRRPPGDAHRRSHAERSVPATSSLIDLGTAHPAHNVPTPQLLLSIKAACAEFNDEFSSNGQNDAHELLITLLGVIDKEVCRSKPRSYETFKDVEDEKKCDAYARWVRRLREENDSTVYDFFGGITGCTVKCASCQLISYRFEALLDISLPMAYRAHIYGGRTAIESCDGKRGGKTRTESVVAVDELLREMFFSDRGEFLDGPMQTTCDRCKKLRDKTIWSSMEQWPPVLVLHLKRFNNAGAKNEAAVVYPYTFRPFGHVKYQLYGVCCHRGTASFGHYTSYTYKEKEEDAAAAPLSHSSQHSLKSSGNSDRVNGAAEEQRGGRVAGFGCAEDVPKESGAEAERAPVGRSHNGCGKERAGPASAMAKSGRWHLCNDDTITEVTAQEALSMTKEAYILFYRRVHESRVAEL